jgi:uncharacterized protein involved in exopolysaccharide biosynthesis
MNHEVTGQERPDRRTVYIVPEDVLGASKIDDLSLREVWNVIWRGRWLVVATTVVLASVSVAYALLATEWYRSEVLLAPANAQSTPAIAGELGGLAALAGVSMGNNDSSEAIATLTSREFARDFIRRHDLVKVFFADDWDTNASRWLQDDPESWPDVRDAVKYFHEKVLKVSSDTRTGLVTVRVDWTDPAVATEWVDELVKRLNAKMRERALREAEVNVAYLRSELDKTSLVTLQQSIGRLLETELQKLMMARGNEEFAFRIIDSSGPLKDRVWPKRALVVTLGSMLGAMLGVLAVFFRRAISPANSATATGK